jgi:hypothetical protein
MQLNSVTRRKGGLLIREVDGEILVLDPERDQVHQLNASASLIWRHYDNGAEIEEIVKKLVMAFDLDEDRAGRDVLAALEDFRRLELIR